MYSFEGGESQWHETSMTTMAMKGTKNKGKPEELVFMIILLVPPHRVVIIRVFNEEGGWKQRLENCFHNRWMANSTRG